MSVTYPANVDNSYAYLGQGLAFPFVISSGRVGYQSGLSLVEQSMMIILNTPIGTRYFLYEFGSGIKEILFEPNDEVLESLLTYYITDALTKWEPRIKVLSVEFDHDTDNGTVLCSINYQLLNSTDVKTLIYPYMRAVKY